MFVSVITYTGKGRERKQFEYIVNVNKIAVIRVIGDIVNIVLTTNQDDIQHIKTSAKESQQLLRMVQQRWLHLQRHDGSRLHRVTLDYWFNPNHIIACEITGVGKDMQVILACDTSYTYSKEDGYVDEYAHGVLLTGNDAQKAYQSLQRLGAWDVPQQPQSRQQNSQKQSRKQTGQKQSKTQAHQNNGQRSRNEGYNRDYEPYQPRWNNPQQQWQGSQYAPEPMYDNRPFNIPEWQDEDENYFVGNQWN